MTDEYKLQTPHISLDQADEKARPLLERAQQTLGFVPNMYQGMAIAPAVLSTYMHGYDLFRQASGFTPAEQEVVFLTISRYNDCKYCMSAHSMLADKMSNVPATTLEALRSRQPIPDERLAALSQFVECMVDRRGVPTTGDVEAFLAAGFREEQILQVVLAIAVKTLSNYSNHLAQPEVDTAFSAYRWQDQ